MRPYNCLQDNAAAATAPTLETGTMNTSTALKTIAAAALLACAVAPACPANAAPETPKLKGATPELLTIADPEFVREVARGYGTSRIATDSLGDPMINAKASGLSYYVFFYDCTKAENCTSVQLQAGFDLGKPVEMGLINEWNIKKRFAKAELNDKGHGILRMDYSFIGGATREHFDNAMSLWMLQLKEFAKQVGFKY